MQDLCPRNAKRIDTGIHPQPGSQVSFLAVNLQSVFLLSRLTRTHRWGLTTARYSIVWICERSWIVRFVMPSVYRLADSTASSTTDTSTNAPSILSINGVFCGFTVLVVLARIYVRMVMLKTMGMDDYLMTAATVCTIPGCLMQQI
jgi:hypothetical protein